MRLHITQHKRLDIPDTAKLNCLRITAFVGGEYALRRDEKHIFHSWPCIIGYGRPLQSAFLPTIFLQSQLSCIIFNGHISETVHPIHTILA